MTDHLDCPNCGVKLQWQSKLRLGPARAIRCMSCSSRVSVSGPHSVTVTMCMVFLVMLVAFSLPSDAFLKKVFLNLFLVFLVAAIHVLYVPLVLRKS